MSQEMFQIRTNLFGELSTNISAWVQLFRIVIPTTGEQNIHALMSYHAATSHPCMLPHHPRRPLGLKQKQIKPKFSDHSGPRSHSFLYTKVIAARNKQTPILGSNWLGCLPTIQPFCRTLLHQLIHCSSQNHKIIPKERHQKITNFPLTAEEKNLTPFTIQSSSLMILKSGFFFSKDPVD